MGSKPDLKKFAIRAYDLDVRIEGSKIIYQRKGMESPFGAKHGGMYVVVGALALAIASGILLATIAIISATQAIAPNGYTCTVLAIGGSLFVLGLMLLHLYLRQRYACIASGGIVTILVIAGLTVPLLTR